MTDSQFALVVVSVLAVASNAFWAWNSHVLINKLMSRSFGEYKEASVTTDKRKAKNIVAPDFAIDPMDSMTGFN